MFSLCRPLVVAGVITDKVAGFQQRPQAEGDPVKSDRTSWC